ncbi:hypothetical protein BZA77DRAFT_168421 [Pyronema omphalodes]|nr:hypothetical protein BZA77DRAFT_168421 [Pyronema omphalodes]
MPLQSVTPELLSAISSTPSSSNSLPSIIFSCSSCERILTDSSHLLCQTQHRGLTFRHLLCSISADRIFSSSGWDENTVSSHIFCQKCNQLLGRTFFGTPNHLVHLQGAFTVDIEKLLVYYVGTQEPSQKVLEDPEVIALLNPQPNDVAQQLQGLKSVCVTLWEELGEVKEKLTRIAGDKGDTTQLMDRIGRLEQQVSMHDEGFAEVKEQVANANSGADGVGDRVQLLERIGTLEKQLSMQTEESGAILVAMKKERVEQEKAHRRAMQKLEQQREELHDCARQIEEVKAHYMGVLEKSPPLMGNITQSTSMSHKRKQGADFQHEPAVVISPPSTVRSVIPDSQSTDGNLSFLEEDGGRRSLRSEQVSSQPPHSMEIVEETRKSRKVRRGNRLSGGQNSVVVPDLETDDGVQHEGATPNEETTDTKARRMSQSFEIVITDKQKTTRSTRRSGTSLSHDK